MQMANSLFIHSQKLQILHISQVLKPSGNFFAWLLFKEQLFLFLLDEEEKWREAL